MYCPRCGQQQTNQQIRFCSRCGFLMAGMQSIVANGGLTNDMLQSSLEGSVSPKIRGLKQGGIMLLGGMIIVPMLGVLSAILDVEPVLAGIAAIVLFWGGILRMIYALIFQSGKKTDPEKAGFTDSLRETFLGRTASENTLPPQYSQPANVDFPDYQPRHMNWRETSDLERMPGDDFQARTYGEK